jgi:hypothetical protein
MKLTTMITKKNIVYNKYKDYSVEELIQDEHFIRSMTNPTQESDAFWRKIVEAGILSSKNYQLACQIFDSLQVHSDSISNEEIEVLWDHIKIAGNNLKLKKKKKQNSFLLWTLSGVASLFVLFIIYIKILSPSSDANTDSMIEHVVAPTELITDIQLILGDDETMALEGKEAEITYDDEGIAINNDRKLEKQVYGKEEIIYNQLIVPKGKRSTLAFEDGSKIWVNANTRVVYPAVFTGTEREIYVDGEIFLDVFPEKTRPFIVKSKDFNVEVLGTSFDLMAYEEDEIQHLVLVSGSVKIRSKNKKEILLSPNEMYLLDKGISSIQEVDVNDYISWKSGIYQYQSERLDIIMKRLSRYYGEDINCKPEVAHLKCSGKLDLKDDLDVVLQGISLTAPVKYQLNGGTYMIINK